MKATTKLTGTLAAIALATLAIVGLSMTGAAAVATEQVTIDDPTNDTVEVDVDYSSSVDATVELINDSGTVVDSQTISGAADATETFSLSASEAGTYDVNLTTTGTDTDVALNETRLLAERTVTVEDATEETLTVDVGFAGETNATAAISVTDSNDTEIYADTLEYVGDETTHSVEINDSDGLINDTLTVTAETSPASAYDGAWATVSTPSDSILGGSIAGQDTGVVLGAVILGGLGYAYYRRD